MSAAGNTSLLHTIAQVYLELGYAVIPVHDNKVAAVEWKSYQRRRPTQTDLQHWFTTEQYPGLAIVTGSISNLVVLDFDDPALFQQFQTRFSDLAETRTVQTKRGYHLYFHLPPQLRLGSRKVPGIDLLSDGRYVVAPPSIIDGYTYKIIRGGQPKTLSAQDSAHIEGFVESVAMKATARAKGAFQVIEGVSCKIAPEPSAQFLTANDLVGLYRYLTPREGRNEALFKVSLRARDAGWSLAATGRTLADIHARHLPNGVHKVETVIQRRREAERTIHSAFSRPPRPIAQTEPEQLPNTVREALFKRKLTCVVRVIEGLRLKGVQPRMRFTEAQARELLAGLVGKHSIREALTAGNPVFTPSGLPLTSNDVATKTNPKHISQCFEITGSKPELIHSGRPSHIYQMPGNAELAAKLGVKLTRISDPITEDDLQSARLTRQAAHREYIRRRPGQYPRTWLAARLGVSIATEKRYNREVPITVTPMYTETPIFWWNLGHVPDDIDIPGLFLLDERGKRYPARQFMARKLLGQHHRVSLLRRGCNFYSYGEQLPVIKHVQIHPERQVLAIRPEAIYVKACLPQAVGQGGNLPKPVHHAQNRSTVTTATMRHETRKARASKRRYRKPLEEAGREALAQRVYTMIEGISEVTARRLVDQYDPRLVEKALSRVGRDHKIRRPAGFLITFLRSEAKATGTYLSASGNFTV